MSAKNIRFVIAFLLFAVICNARTVKSQDWIRLEMSAKNFSLALPQNYLVDKENLDASFFVRPIAAEPTNIFTGSGLPKLIKVNSPIRLMAYLDKTYIDFEERQLFQVSRAKDYLWHFIPHDSLKDYRIQDFEVEDFFARLYVRESSEISAIKLYITYKEKVFILSSRVDAANTTVLKKLLRSVRLNGKVILKEDQPNATEIVNSVPISSLKTSSEINAALANKSGKQTSKLIFGQNYSTNDNQNEHSEDKKIYSRPLLILRQPRKYAYFEPGEKFTGVVRFKISFLSSGSIGEVVLLTDTPKSLAQKLFKEIQEIKFLPAQIDGNSVDFNRTMEYQFDIK